MSDTVAAKSPVAQSIRIAIRNGRIKKSDLPSVVSRNSSDFRGAISTKEPNTTKPKTDKIVRGECKIECVFVIHAVKLKSISSLALGKAPLASGEAPLAFGEAPLAFGEAPLAFGDETALPASLKTLGELAGLLALLRTILIEPQTF
jgi:hypothetical protein